jgi:hypothetical protein
MSNQHLDGQGLLRNGDRIQAKNDDRAKDGKNAIPLKTMKSRSPLADLKIEHQKFLS